MTHHRLAFAAGAALCLAAGAGAQDEEARSRAMLEIFDAERAFAVRAQEIGARDAFLEVIPEDGLGFTGGVSEWREAWEGFPESDPNAVLTWRPAYGGAALMGDLGFSTGPYQRLMGDEVAGEGHYFSAWRRDEAGWRLLFDGGVQLDRANSRAQIIALSEHAERWSGPLFADHVECVVPGEVTGPDDRLNELAGIGAAGDLIEGDEEAFGRASVMRSDLPLAAAEGLAWPGGEFERTHVVYSAARDLAFTFGNWSGGGQRTRGYVRVWRGDACRWALELDVME